MNSLILSASSLLSGDQGRAKHAADTGAYPVNLAETSVSPQVLQRFSWWAQWYGWDTSALVALPWLPVGSVGPLLVLGHFDLNEKAPLAFGAFQAVLLTREDYDRHFKQVWPLLQLVPKVEWRMVDADIVPPRNTSLPERWILPNGLHGALEWMLSYTPNTRGCVQELRHLLHRPPSDLTPDALPDGYMAAAWKLMQRGQIVDLTGLKISEELKARVPTELRGSITPVAYLGQRLWVASSRSQNVSARDVMLNHLGDGWHVEFLLSPSIESRVAGTTPAIGSASVDKVVIQEREVRPTAKGDDKEWRTSGEDVIEISEMERAALSNYSPQRADRDPEKVFRKFVILALEQNASDLHFEPGVDKMVVRGRVDGKLEEWLEAPIAFGRNLIGAASTATNCRKENHQPEDQKCKVRMGDIEVNVRVSALPIRASDRKLVLRFLPRKGEAPALDTLLPERELKYMRRALQAPSGLILLCGPTGSGKTTTIASCLSEINSPDRNITTMEDPVEYEINGVNQAEVDEARGVKWGELLRSFLRQDPDSGLLGEIRDGESATAAIRVALTGHLVFATVHTISCAETMERLLDMGINSNMLASALTLVVSQRLVRRLCTNPKCRREYAPSSEQAAVYQRHGLPVPAMLVRPSDSCGKGCKCRSGYKGRIASVEMLPVTARVKDLIVEHRRAREFGDWMRTKGLFTVHENALKLAAQGITSFEEANEWQEVWEEFSELQHEEQRLEDKA